ncbi:MAG TPA: hypothetical protein VLL52_10015 [Anaerolineae bacterium]|nr:hypothetical protein [Anaerolineae bacterium]
MKPINKTNHSFIDLTHHLLHNPTTTQWHQWHITPITGGMNNLIYRLTHQQEHTPYALKLMKRDVRRRGWHEWQTLETLRLANLPLGPTPLYYNNTHFPTMVVVQQWLPGTVTTAHPTTHHPLLTFFTQLHTITPLTPPSPSTTRRPSPPTNQPIWPPSSTTNTTPSPPPITTTNHNGPSPKLNASIAPPGHNHNPPSAAATTTSSTSSAPTTNGGASIGNTAAGPTPPST